jgi:hypothetical protein
MPDETDSQLANMTDDELRRHLRQLELGMATFEERGNFDGVERLLYRMLDVAAELERRAHARTRRDMRDLQRGAFLPRDEYRKIEEGRI